MSSAEAAEARRLTQARSAPIEVLNEYVAMVTADDEWGLDQWIEVASVVVVYLPATGKILVRVRDAQVARRLFGAGGLQRVTILGTGWSVHELVGFSPAGQQMAAQDAAETARKLADAVIWQ